VDTLNPLYTIMAEWLEIKNTINILTHYFGISLKLSAEVYL